MRPSGTLISCLLLVLVICQSCSNSVHGPGKADTTNSAPPAELPGNDSASQQVVEQIVLQNEKKMWEAFRAKDMNAAGALVAEDVQIVTADGRFTKAEFLKLISDFPEIPSYSIDKARVISPSKDVAILTYESRYTFKESVLRSYLAYQTTVWVNRGSKWLAVYNQETQVPSR